MSKLGYHLVCSHTKMIAGTDDLAVDLSLCQVSSASETREKLRVARAKQTVTRFIIVILIGKYIYLNNTLF